jgi:hypothetical protein
MADAGDVPTGTFVGSSGGIDYGALDGAMADAGDVPTGTFVGDSGGIDYGALDEAMADASDVPSGSYAIVGKPASGSFFPFARATQ